MNGLREKSERTKRNAKEGKGKMTNVKIPLTVTRAVRLYKVLNARNTTIDFLLAEGLNNLSDAHTREKGYFLPVGLNNPATCADVGTAVRGAVAAGAEAAAEVGAAEGAARTI